MDTYTRNPVILSPRCTSNLCLVLCIPSRRLDIAAEAMGGGLSSIVIEKKAGVRDVPDETDEVEVDEKVMEVCCGFCLLHFVAHPTSTYKTTCPIHPSLASPYLPSRRGN